MELSANAQKIAESRYFWDNETKWDHLAERICRENAKNEGDKAEKYYGEFYSIIEPLDFIPAGRILRNLGKLRPSTSNCNFLPLEDSIESIGETLKNYLIISSYGGGNGIDFSALRPKGAPLITKGGNSSGLVSFMEIFNHAGKRIETGGARRSAGIALCHISHPEIREFINAKIKHNKLTQFNISVIVDSGFLKAVEEDNEWDLKFAGKVYETVRARELWDMILNNMLEHSEPGLINWDNLRKNNSYYFSPIRGVNPCVTGNTLVAVADGRGNVPIKQLADEGKDVPVFCSDSNNNVTVRLMRNPRITGYKERILKITLNDGSIIRCTENHGILMLDGTYKRADELKENDRLHHAVKFHASFKDVFLRANSRSQDYVWWNVGKSTNKAEHRIIAEFNLGRKLKPGEIVHHNDFNGLNNEWVNLEPMLKKDHDKLHAQDMLGRNNPVNRFPEKNWLIKQNWSGKNNGRWTGLTPEEIFQIAIDLMRNIGRKVTKDEWQKYCKTNSIPWSNCAFGKYKSASSMLKAAAKEAGVYMKGYELKAYRKFLVLKDTTDLDVFFENGSIWVNKQCENCGRIFSVKWHRREQSYCSTRCAGTSKAAFLGQVKYAMEKGYKHRMMNYNIVSIEEDGYEDVYNGTVDEFHNFYVMVSESKTENGKKKFNYINNLQCGELPLEEFGCCNLGALVLPHFIINKNTDWKKLSRTIKIAVRFMDNVIDLAYYPIPQQEIVVKNARRIGLGTMGLADYLFMKEIRYGSERAIAEVEKLYRFIRDEAYIASVELAKEKGAFPKYNRIDYASASFVRKLPAKIRMLIKENSIRNVTLTTAAPTGCLVDGTLISSEIGTKRIKEKKKINLRVGRGRNSTKSDFKDVHIKAYYDQGIAKTKSIKTKHGYKLQGTFDHKVRVLTDGNGYSWKSLGDIEKGDLVVLKKGFLYDKRQTWLSDHKAELLGYYMADGWWTVNGRSHRLYFETSNNNEAEYISNLIYKSFGDVFKIKVYKRDRLDSKSVRLEIGNKQLYDWFQKHGCIKYGAINAFIPDIILSGSLNNIISFISGYHRGNGHIRKEDNRIGFTTISETMANQIQTILLGLGFVSHLKETKENNSIIEGREVFARGKAYRISVNRYNSVKLLKLLYNIDVSLPKNGDRELIILTPDELMHFNSQHLSYTKDRFSSNNNVICTTKANYISRIDSMNWFVKNDLCFDVVSETNVYDNMHVNDLEIYEDSHTYIANGFITHNTTSLLADVVGGIEPLPFKGYLRSDRVSDRIYIHPLCKEHYDSEWFVDSYDLKPEEHLEMQSTIAKYLDGSVSKTILLPKSSTAEDLSKILLEYIYDLKGVTVYRDESREKQVYYRMSRKEKRDREIH